MRFFAMSFAMGLCALSAACSKPTYVMTFATLKTFENCSVPTRETWWIGDRAMIAKDGSLLVYQCSDGTVYKWDTVNTIALGKEPLIGAGIATGIVPKGVACVSAESGDCDIVDHTSDWTSYVTFNTAIYQLASGGRPQRTVPGYLGAVLLPRTGPATEIISGGSTGPKAVEIRSLDAWVGRTPLAVAPSRNGIYQNNETGFFRVAWSNAYDFLLVGCGGSFMYFDGEVSFLRAYGRDGAERWKIERRLPKPESGAFVGIFAKPYVFAGGKYAAVTGGTGNDSSFEVIDLKDGRTVATLEGKVIGAAQDANEILVRRDVSHIALLKLDL